MESEGQSQREPIQRAPKPLGIYAILEAVILMVLVVTYVDVQPRRSQDALRLCPRPWIAHESRWHGLV